MIEISEQGTTTEEMKSKKKKEKQDEYSYNSHEYNYVLESHLFLYILCAYIAKVFLLLTITPKECDIYMRKFA